LFCNFYVFYMKNLVGYQWLSKKYNVSPVQSFEFKSISDQAGKNRSDTLSWHITFALKHEGIHLEFLNRLFKVIEETKLVDWINSEPSGQYARRAGFLYEWFADKSLECPGVKMGNYIDMIDSESCFTSDSPSNNSRWRVRDNLPGTRDYCPMDYNGLRRYAHIGTGNIHRDASCRRQFAGPEIKDAFGSRSAARVHESCCKHPPSRWQLPSLPNQPLAWFHLARCVRSRRWLPDAQAPAPLSLQILSETNSSQV